jgi:hypothetical protein
VVTELALGALPFACGIGMLTVWIESGIVWQLALGWCGYKENIFNKLR